MSIFQLLEQEALFLLLYVAVIGLCVGSFLNVVIYRLPVMLSAAWQAEAREILQFEAESLPRFNLAFPPSTCPCCKSPIRAWQNIPVVSYLILRGRCANCKNRISLRYPLVELLTGVLSLILAINLGYGWPLVAMLLFTYCCIALAGIDYDQQLLPDCLTLPLLWLGLFFNTQNIFVSLHDAVYGAIAGYGFLWLVFWLYKLVSGKEGMGYGDFKLMAVFGAWFGWQLLPNIILLSSLLGALVGISMMIIIKRDAAKPIPFGPFIIFAGWATAVFPQYVTLTNYL